MPAEYILFIYCIKNPKSICVKNVRSYKRFYRTRYLRQNLGGGVLAPLAFSQSTCGGSSDAQFTVSTAFCTPLFFFSVLVKLPLFAAFLDAPEIK